MDLNLLSILICVSNVLFLLFILSTFGSPSMFLFFFTLLTWLTSQVLILYYGIIDNKVGFIFMPIITIIIVITTSIFQMGSIRLQMKEVEIDN